MDILVQMKNNFGKPEEMVALKKRLTGEKLKRYDEIKVRCLKREDGAYKRAVKKLKGCQA